MTQHPQSPPPQSPPPQSTPHPTPAQAAPAQAPESTPPASVVPSPASEPVPPSSTGTTRAIPAPTPGADRSASLLWWTPAAVVFDCDGTLMDTERHWQDARALTLDDYGLRAAPGAAERWKGLHYAECGRLMAAETGRRELAEALTGALLAHFRSLVAARPTTMPGAPELVAAAAKFAPLAVASNCPADVVETCLSTAGLMRYFDHIVVPTAGVRPKPAPDLYLTAVRLCGVSPQDGLAVEDSACGVEAAVRAGLRVMGVGPWPGDEIVASVDLWVDRLDDAAVVEWAARRVANSTAS